MILHALSTSDRVTVSKSQRPTVHRIFFTWRRHFERALTSCELHATGMFGTNGGVPGNGHISTCTNYLYNCRSSIACGGSTYLYLFALFEGKKSVFVGVCQQLFFLPLPSIQNTMVRRLSPALCITHSQFTELRWLRLELWRRRRLRWGQLGRWGWRRPHVQPRRRPS